MMILGTGDEFLGCIVVAIRKGYITIRNFAGNCKNISFNDVESIIFGDENVRNEKL